MTSFALNPRQFISSAENIQFARIFSRAHLLRKGTLIPPPHELWIRSEKWFLIMDFYYLLSRLIDSRSWHFTRLCSIFNWNISLTKVSNRAGVSRGGIIELFCCYSYRNLCSKKNKRKSQDNRRESKRFPFNVWVSFLLRLASDSFHIRFGKAWHKFPQMKKQEKFLMRQLQIHSRQKRAREFSRRSIPAIKTKINSPPCLEFFCPNIDFNCVMFHF